ncbi:MAG: hypothetical protein NC548_05785 [Lachnospiraceae bacterium]|nr:hypothetical protein [Lachnospiraceae bacterium]
MSYPYSLNLRAGSYASYQALVNDTNDGVINPPVQAGDCYKIALPGGVDADGNKIYADAIVVYDGTKYHILSQEDAATL